jgi:glycosyltransferase involved in cell wall biosynthesis
MTCTYPAAESSELHVTAQNRSGQIGVLYLIGGRRIGGMETHLLRLVAAINSSFRCLICCLDPSPEYLHQISGVGVEHVSLRCPSLVSPSAVKAYLALERLVLDFKPHVVHSYGFACDLLAGALAARRRVRHVVTSRRGEDSSSRHRRLRRLVNRVSDKIVCVSAETAGFVEATEGPHAGLLSVIPNGVSTTSTSPLACRPADAARPVRFGTLGTVKPIKGSDLLVDAFLKFEKQQPVQLVVAGLIDRPWAESLRDRALRASDGRIEFIGRSADPNLFLSSLDVFVLPSRSEGMSNALLEAMALGLPCVATDVGSNRSLLTPQDGAPAGLVCRSTPDDLFAAMSHLAGSPEVRMRYGTEAHKRVRQHYSIEAMATRYAGLYHSLVERGNT